MFYDCGGRRVRAIPVGRIEVARSDPQAVQLSVVIAPLKGEADSPLFTLPEHLTTGPGTPVGASSAARQVITDVMP